MMFQTHIRVADTRQPNLSCRHLQRQAKVSRVRIRHVRCGSQQLPRKLSFYCALARLYIFYPDRVWCRGNCRAANWSGKGSGLPIYPAKGVLLRQIVAQKICKESTHSRPGSVIAAAILPRQGFGTCPTKGVLPRQILAKNFGTDSTPY